MADPSSAWTKPRWIGAIAMYLSLSLAITALSLLPRGRHGGPVEIVLLVAQAPCLIAAGVYRRYAAAGLVLIFAIVTFIRF